MELIDLLRSENNNKWVNLVRVIGLIGLVIAIVFYFYLVLNFVFE
ncbi:hypothetical protein [Flavobacterium sp.]|nr:hypothetical protein [Flavobacterium sp.]HLP63851.1 hypothetical protein [Flavobacterium sp.]